MNRGQRILTDEMILGPFSAGSALAFESSSHNVPSVSAERANRTPERVDSFPWSRLIMSSEALSSEVSRV